MALRPPHPRRLDPVLVLVLVAVLAPRARAQDPGDSAPAPTAGLVHEAVTTAQRGSAVPITVGVQSGLTFERMMLLYRAGGQRDYKRREMKRVAEGTYRGEIPAQATVGETIEYYVEALDRDGAPVAGRASAGTPLVIELQGPAPALRMAREETDDEEVEEAPAGRRFFVALLLGSGAGWATGNGDTNADEMLRPSTFALARLGQLAPEIGYFVNASLMLSLQGRFQAVTGTTDVYASDGVHRTANYAAAGFFKATWFSREESSLHPFFSLAAGGGQIRHVVTFDGLTSCGPTANRVCVDTIAAGPIAAGPGGGVVLDLRRALSLVLQLNTQLTFPAFSFNVDGNVGVALRF
jgi:hypothetical protein